MKDRLWQTVYDALQPLLSDRDVIAAPRGDWPAFPGNTILYDDQIELDGCTVLILHKGLLTSLCKGALRVVAREWQWVFANEVFLVFSRARRAGRQIRCSANSIHWRPLVRYLCSTSLRRRHSKIVYVHVPKTGGTSMWASLTKAFPSHVYYPTLRAYLNNPPAPDEYDLIGLHFSPSVLLPSLRRDDWVIGMVRNPAQRLLSAVMHSRRETEDIKTFTPAARAMREMGLVRYLATDFGRVEACLQLIMFGTDHGQSADMLSDCDMLRTARAFVKRDNVILAPSELSAAFVRFVSRRLGFRPGALWRLNANEPGTSAINPAEAWNAIGLIDAINAHEREFYDFVCRSFDELRAAYSPPRARTGGAAFVSLHRTLRWRELNSNFRFRAR
jgi:hypothetical protein